MTPTRRLTQMLLGLTIILLGEKYHPATWSAITIADFQALFLWDSSAYTYELPSDVNGGELSAFTPVPSDGPPISPTATEKTLEVDLSEQVVYLYVGNLLFDTLTVSTGRLGYETLPGAFQILNKLPVAHNYDWGWTFNYWLGIYWAGSYQNGFHALPIDADGHEVWSDQLGAPISYGSILLSQSDAMALYSFCEEGTQVVIHP